MASRNEEIKDNFLDWYAANFEQQEEKFRKYCSHKRLIFNEDILAETIVKICERILKKGLADVTEKGFENFLFKAFKNNIVREYQYSRNAKKNEVDDIWKLVKEVEDTHVDKILRDAKEDFSAIFILKKVEEAFGSNWLHFFVKKYYLGMTYRQLKEEFPNIPHLRERLLEIKKYIKATITKNDIEKAFEEFLEG